jgi:hypothetical protein
MIDDIRKRLVIDSIGMRSLADPFPTVHLTFRRRQLPEEALVMTVGLAEPLYGDMSDKEILRAAWHTLLPLMEADRSGETNPALETVTRWRG